MQATINPEQPIPYILEDLPKLEIPGEVCPRRSRINLDFLLIALESLDLDAAEHLKGGIRELQLTTLIKNRVALWRIRNSNPLRRFSKRRPLSLVEAQALVALICYLSRRQTAQIRQLLIANAQLQAENLTPDHHFQLSQYLERFRGHFRSRMNPNRSAVALYGSAEDLNQLALSLLQKALFCTGTAGMQRLWTSLFDGEVA
ncbi:DUF3038 domain-containing protein [Lyngbya confervoides]|uniref:DUF3038 domain-containing protein n=1 Tax=Lyngbya confervoides BDU141951 TaxID=1574623 RepID=A0ABD4T1V3_9CYAN|nr:DUF3038 domain-containing protein [Lyngbya confervoides]MCM1982478.1 DUF3038 domain-containing protein [Lyngbya confervoides BDU141951]